MRLPTIYPQSMRRPMTDGDLEAMVQEARRQRASKGYWLRALARATIERPVHYVAKLCNPPRSETEDFEMPDGSVLTVTRRKAPKKARTPTDHDEDARDIDGSRQAHLQKLIVDMPRHVPLSTIHILCRNYLNQELGPQPPPIPTTPVIIRPQTVCLCPEKTSESPISFTESLIDSSQFPSPFNENYLVRPENWQSRDSL
ncbi:hypothetical protein QBC43DRAFT_326558 [Cladorrhinum sp. PSN259]|nr:hypothetical protein QBC43DRAFT_326558 [Cladorrhinum sp. PSN259]